jgi:hypothetical protein
MELQAMQALPSVGDTEAGTGTRAVSAWELNPF